MSEVVLRIPPFKVEAVFTACSETVDWGIDLLGIQPFWRHTKGGGIKIAVLDTGIALTHPDLQDAILDAKDFTNSRSGPSDTLGHGTAVAGIMAARENSSGVIGVAPKSKLLIAKVLDDNGAGTARAVLDSLNWAAEQGAHVISMSLGTVTEVPGLHQEIKKAAKRCRIICAAGNEGPDLGTVNYPARFPETISVGAIDRRRKIAKFSSRGGTVDIVAPGDRILTTYPPRGLARMNGTSMATPLVSGVVALMLSSPSGIKIKTTKGLRKVLRETAVDMGAPGRDPHYGWGIINPTKLLNHEFLAKSASITLTPEDLSDSGMEKLGWCFDGTQEVAIIVRESE